MAFCFAVPTAYAKVSDGKVLVNPAPICCLAVAPNLDLQIVDVRYYICKRPDLPMTYNYAQARNQATITPFRLCNHGRLSTVTTYGRPAAFPYLE